MLGYPDPNDRAWRVRLLARLSAADKPLIREERRLFNLEGEVYSYLSSALYRLNPRLWNQLHNEWDRLWKQRLLVVDQQNELASVYSYIHWLTNAGAL